MRAVGTGLGAPVLPLPRSSFAGTSWSSLGGRAGFCVLHGLQLRDRAHSRLWRVHFLNQQQTSKHSSMTNPKSHSHPRVRVHFLAGPGLKHPEIQTCLASLPSYPSSSPPSALSPPAEPQDVSHEAGDPPSCPLDSPRGHTQSPKPLGASPHPNVLWAASSTPLILSPRAPWTLPKARGLPGCPTDRSHGCPWTAPSVPQTPTGALQTFPDAPCPLLNTPRTLLGALLNSPRPP